MTGEGRLIPWRMVKPDFFVRDHLGSVRAVVSGDGRVLETNSYYPYGMKIDALSSSDYASSDVRNRYKYNGKELFSESGLDWYAYGKRFYDAAVGRFWGRDALAEKAPAWTPYAYTFDAPIGLVDPDGNWPWEPRNVREARRYARQTGGEFEKWRGHGKHHYWYASVTRTSISRAGVFVNARVFKPNSNAWQQNAVYNVFDWTLGWTDRIVKDGYSDPVNSGRITKEDARVGIGIMSLLFSGGTIAEIKKGVGVILEGLNMLNTLDDLMGDGQESYLESKMNGKNEKDIVKKTKTSISFIGFINGIFKKETYQSFYQLGSTMSSGKSVYEDLKKDYEK